MEHVLAGGGKGGEGAAVEGVAQGQDGAAAGAVLVVAVFAGQLEHSPSLASAPGVAEEGRRHARLGRTGRSASRGVGLGVEQVGDVAQGEGLVVDGAGPTSRSRSPPSTPRCREVKSMYVLPARSAEGGPLSVVHVHVEAAVGLEGVGVVQRLEFVKGGRDDVGGNGGKVGHGVLFLDGTRGRARSARGREPWPRERPSPG